MNEKLSSLQLQIQNESEDLKLLQSQKVALMREKDRLLRETESGDGTSENQSLVSGDKTMYSQVLPLVSEIHQLEMRKQEIHHQLHLLDVHKDVQQIFTTLTSVGHTEERGQLHPWYRQLKSTVCVSDEKAPACLLKQPSYESDMKGNILMESLGFAVTYGGISLHLTVSTQTCLDEIMCTEKRDHSIEDSVTVTSDIHLQGLEDKTRYLLKHKHSVLELVDFIQVTLDNDVVPFK